MRSVLRVVLVALLAAGSLGVAVPASGHGLTSTLMECEWRTSSFYAYLADDTFSGGGLLSCAGSYEGVPALGEYNVWMTGTSGSPLGGHETCDVGSGEGTITAYENSNSIALPDEFRGSVAYERVESAATFTMELEDQDTLHTVHLDLAATLLPIWGPCVDQPDQIYFNTVNSYGIMTDAGDDIDTPPPPDKPSDDCAVENGGDRWVDTTTAGVHATLYTLQAPSNEVWVCARVEDTSGDGYGGRLAITPSAAVPTVLGPDADAGACSTTTPNMVPGPHPASEGWIGPVYHLIDAYADGGEAWLCLMVDSDEYQVIVPLTDAGNAVTWYPDPELDV